MLTCYFPGGVGGSSSSINGIGGHSRPLCSRERNSSSSVSASSVNTIASQGTVLMSKLCPYPYRPETNRSSAEDGGSSSGGSGGGGGRNGGRNNNGGSSCAANPSAAVVNSPPASPSAADADNPPDWERLCATMAMLESSGWYYGQLSWREAARLLCKTDVGTFLVRDSADSRFLFSLSVQTERGPTSVRIHYTRGLFQLDAEERIVGAMPLFPCVVALVQHYVTLSGTQKPGSHVWLDNTGRRDLPIRLSRPLNHRVPSLQQLCRRTIHELVPSHRLGDLDLPKPLVKYLQEYPYSR